LLRLPPLGSVTFELPPELHSPFQGGSTLRSPVELPIDINAWLKLLEQHDS